MTLYPQQLALPVSCLTQYCNTGICGGVGHYYERARLHATSSRLLKVRHTRDPGPMGRMGSTRTERAHAVDHGEGEGTIRTNDNTVERDGIRESALSNNLFRYLLVTPLSFSGSGNNLSC